MNKANRAHYLYVKYRVDVVIYLTLLLAIVIGCSSAKMFAAEAVSSVVATLADSRYAAEPPSDGFLPEQADTVDVDVSSVGLEIGDLYEVRNAQNYFGPIVLTGVYDGNPISLPMTGMEPAQPIGPGLIEPSEFTGTEFNVFVIRKIEGDPTNTDLESISATEADNRLFFVVVALCAVVIAITLGLILARKKPKDFPSG